MHAQHTLLNCLGQAPRLPPSIGLHSFSGTAHDVKQLLALPSCGERLYFGFSHTVNVAMGGGPGTDGHNSLLAAIRAVPTNRLLVESDVDDPGRAPHATLLAAELDMYMIFGCVEREDGSDDLFCHATQIRDGFMRRPS